MVTRSFKAVDGRDKGFTLLELPAFIIVIGTLAAIASTGLLNQQAKDVDTSLKSELKSAATAAGPAAASGCYTTVRTSSASSTVWTADYSRTYLPVPVLIQPRAGCTPTATETAAFTAKVQALSDAGAPPSGMVPWGTRGPTGVFIFSYDATDPNAVPVSAEKAAATVIGRLQGLGLTVN